MEQIIIKDKQQYLNDNYPFDEVPNLTDQRLCIHCDAVFTVGDYKVFKDQSGDAFSCCANATDCDGTVIDWFQVE